MLRLHYLYEQQQPYEQQATGREHFVYYCNGCRCVLRVRRDLGPASETIESLGGRCLGCGLSLEENVECRFAPVPKDWAHLYVSTVPTFGQKSAPFLQASSLPHFSLGFPRLDSLLRPFSTKNLFVLRGPASSAIAELAAFRAQFPIEAGGFDSAALFIDGGNRSDPYLLSSFAKQHRIRPRTVMRRIATCRVFTFYQLADLVSRHLVRAAQDYGAKFVIISDLLGTFNEPELEEREARRVLGAIEQGIKKTKENALVLATLPSPNKYDDLVSSWADTMITLSESRGMVQAELTKSRSRPPTFSSFKLNQLLRTVR